MNKQEEVLLQQRMLELMLPIERQIALCVSDDEKLEVACIMLQRASDLFDQVVGEEGRKTMFKGMV